MSLITFQPRKAVNNTPNFFLNDPFFKELLEGGKSTTEANIAKSENGFDISINALGIPKDKVNIELNEKKLIVSYHEEQQKEEKGTEWIQREFSTKSFKKTFTLPEGIDRKGIEAKSENGVLNIHLPFSKEKKKDQKMVIPVK